MIAKKPSNRPKLRGHRAITQFSGLGKIVNEITRLWRRHHLSYDQQIYIAHAKRDAKRYVPILRSLAQELRTHLQGRRQGYLFESNRQTRYSVRSMQCIVKEHARTAGITKRVYPHLLRAFDGHDIARAPSTWRQRTGVDYPFSISLVRA